MYRYLSWVFVAVLVLASSCAPVTPSQTSPNITESVVKTPDSAQSVVPTPIPTVPTPTVSPDGANVVGLLTIRDPTSMTPEENGLYLVPIPPSEENVSFAVPTIDEETAIQAQVDARTGEFIFTAVPAGFYVLVARSDTGLQTSLRYLETGQIVSFDVAELDYGQVIDLGRLVL